MCVCLCVCQSILYICHHSRVLMLTELWNWPKPLTRAAHCDMFYRLRWLWKNFQLDTYAETVSDWPTMYDREMIWKSNCNTFILKCLHSVSEFSLFRVYFAARCDNVLRRGTAWPQSSNRSPDKDVVAWIPLCVSHSSVPRLKNLWVNAWECRAGIENYCSLHK